MGNAVVMQGVSAAPEHSASFRRRRFLNWFPLGLAYAFLYMGRYNLNVAKGALGPLMTPEDFGIIFGVGTFVYGLVFWFNGPLTDRIGGRRAMLISALGAACANLAMGAYIRHVVAAGTVNNQDIRLWFSVLYGINMYFQSFGAVAIVKVNASWFHVRERGSFSGIFGTMISSGIFLAYSVNRWILNLVKGQAPDQSEALLSMWVFFVPSALLFAIYLVELFLLKDRPGEAGHQDFDTGDASSGEVDGLPLSAILRKVVTNPIILTVAAIEFCTGIVRQGVMQSYPFFAADVLALPSSHPMRDGDWSNPMSVVPFFVAGFLLFFIASRLTARKKGLWMMVGVLACLVPFLQAGWGGLLFVAGVIGGNVAGWVSDLFFHSRRAPAAGGLYAVLFLASLGMVWAMGKPTAEVAELQRGKGGEPLMPELQVGDVVVSVAGKGELSDWVAVSNAFAAVPAVCTTPGAVWDAATSLCSTSPKQPMPEAVVSSGVIALEVLRNGQPVKLEVKDPKPKMKAGERRKLAATPVASPSPYVLGAVIFLMSLCVIGTHGLLSGTATMDFGGRKGAATAVGMIDGAVYLGTGFQSIALGYLTTRSWSYWPWFLMPFCLIGFFLSLRIWNARPKAVERAPAQGQAPSDAPAAPMSKTGT